MQALPGGWQAWTTVRTRAVSQVLSQSFHIFERVPPTVWYSYGLTKGKKAAEIEKCDLLPGMKLPSKRCRAKWVYVWSIIQSAVSTS